MDCIPLTKKGAFSLEADMMFGWKPTDTGAYLPIPLRFDQKDDYFDLEHRLGKKKLPDIYRGWRPSNS